MRSRFAGVVVGVVLLASMNTAHALESTFDVDREAWQVVDLPWSEPGSPPTALNVYVPDHHPSGGNPDGHIALRDPSSGPLFYWRAPSKFLGDHSDAYDRVLSYDLASVGTGSFIVGVQEDVILVGAGLTLVHQAFLNPGQTFIHFDISLNEAGWRLGNDSGPAATMTDMQGALGSLEALYIRGEYLQGTDETALLDNVVLESNLASDIIFVSGFEF